MGDEQPHPDHGGGRAPLTRTPTAPVHRSPRLLLAVGAGAALGGPARYGLERVVPATADGIGGTLAVNVLGCLLLGALVETLRLRAARASSTPRSVRAFAGSGLLGTFTTYSAFALQTDLLLRDGRPVLALGYVAASLVGGVAAATAGVLAAHRLLSDGSSPA